MTDQHDSLAGFAASIQATRHALGAARAQAGLLLQDVEAARGKDDREVLVVTLGPSAHVVALALVERWRRTREPEELGEAVGQACEAARKVQDAALAHLVYEAVKLGKEPEPGPLPFGLGEVFGPPTRTLTVLAGDFLDYQARDGRDREFGKNDDGTVTVVANRRGFVSCDVDPRWAAGVEGWHIEYGVVHASDNAREEVERDGESPDTALDIAYDAVRIIWLYRFGKEG